MKRLNRSYPIIWCSFFCILLFSSIHVVAQDTKDSVAVVAKDSAQKAEADSTEPVAVVKKKPVKNTFESNWIQDNQSVMVSIKGTFEMDIQHRFGVVNNGVKDFFGLYAPSNIRIGLSYVVIDKLQLGFGFTKERLQWDINGKYAIIKQDKTGGWPVSVTWFSNFVIDARPKENFVNYGDRFSYFNQLLIARKITEKFSVQVAPSISHFNNVDGYTDSSGKIQQKMKNDHFAIAFMGRYKISPKTNLMVNYDQPITQHPMNNPHPNISFGLEMVTSAHDFQVFVGNYHGIIPQSNNLYNQNDFTKGEFAIGFNITRLWNF